MAHQLDVGDIIDMIEESVMKKRPIVVHLRDGRIFEDRAREIVKWEGQPRRVPRPRADAAPHDLEYSARPTSGIDLRRQPRSRRLKAVPHAAVDGQRGEQLAVTRVDETLTDGDPDRPL